MAQRPLDPVVADFLADSGYTAHNVACATSLLNAYTRWLSGRGTDSILDARREDCRAWLDTYAATPTARTGRPPAAATQRTMWRQMKALYRWALDAGEIDVDPMARMRGPRVMENTDVPTASREDFDAFLADHDPRRYEGARARAMIALMFLSGLRASEVLGLDVGDIDLDGDSRLGPHVHVRNAKNGIERDVPIDDETVRLVRVWLRRHRVGAADGPLFTGNAGTRSAAGRLTYSALNSMLRRYRERTGRHVPAHAWRRGLAVDWLARGGNQATLQTVAGWSDARMVSRYTRTEAVRLAEIEFRRLRAGDPEREDRRRARRLSSVG